MAEDIIYDIGLWMGKRNKALKKEGSPLI